MHVYHSRWHELTDQHIQGLFDRFLKGVSNHPFTLLPSLKRLQIATVDVLEDDPDYTFYRIKETGEIFQVPDRGQAKPLTNFKPPAFIISEKQGFCIIERPKPPRFIATYHPLTKEITEIRWIDGQPNEVTMNSTLKKARGFLKDRVK